VSNSAERKAKGPRRHEVEYPQVFGKYVLLRAMARGGMGELLLAAAGEVGGFEKLCVVKKVIGELADPAVRRRFLDEAKVVVRLNHANLVQVFDAGRVGDDYYLAMELVEGKDLRAIWNRCAQIQRRIPVEFAMFICREICRGLHYVHESMGLDLVHRDISPPNILVSYHGQVKITDFGLAKHSIKRELTLPGIVYGRYSYLAPEQARGQPADRRTDIYATGIILWEMLTGRQLFPTENRVIEQQALAALRNPRVLLPSELVPGIPDGLDRVVKKALEPERADRFQSAGEFRSALTEVLARHHASYDIDHVAEFMREIFAHERRIELQDYASYAREDFSRMRSHRPRSSSYSITSDGVVNIDVEDTSPDTEPTPHPMAPLRSSSNRAVKDTDLVDRSAIPDSGKTPQTTTKWEAPDTGELEMAAVTRIQRVVAGRYRLDRLLGIGGMGAVYVATHLALGRTYALKILHQVYIADSDITARFMREARAATQTGHPNIIDVVDVGTTEEGEAFLVMELLDGLDLGQLLRNNGPLNVRRAIHIARQVCRALGTAHEAGIIHRDLKSENIMIINHAQDPDFVKVLDFGICKHVDGSRTSDTSPGMVIGSPDYMAPEQAAGFEVDVKCDVYALGTVLFEMLTGKVPFEGRNAVDVLMKKGRDDAPSISTLRPDVPVAVADVIARCLKRQRDLRPSSMRVLEYELTRAIDGRASAVAAAMGMRPPQKPVGEAAFASASEAEVAAFSQSSSRVAIESAGSAPATVHDLASRGITPQTVRNSRANLAIAAKALVFVGLGGALSLAIAMRHEERSLEEADETGTTELVVNANEGHSSAPARVAVDSTTASESPHDGAETIAMDATVEPVPGENTSSSPPAEASQAIVRKAEQALARRQWTDPLEDSLLFELGHLARVDPEHEALARLRHEALRTLEPQANNAFKRGLDADALRLYREVYALSPDYEAGRQALISVLERMGATQIRDGAYSVAQRTANELQNISGGENSAHFLRASIYEASDRIDEAAAEYRAVIRRDPQNEKARNWLAKLPESTVDFDQP
jgi:serine/threonine-protein kinase